jgi:hypothetical protein
VLVVSAVLAVTAALAFAAVSDRIGAATGRAVGVVDAVEPGSDGAVVRLRWTPPGGAERVDPVAVSGAPPAPGTRTEVAFDPADPGSPFVPGAQLLVDADRWLTVLSFTVVVALVVVAGTGWQALTRRRAFRQPARTAAVRRVRWQQGLLTRSYLETESSPQRWIPVHFDPVLVGLPAPTTVRLHGDPRRDRFVAATVLDPAGDHPLVPSGPVRSTEPGGHRTDNPSRPDGTVAVRAAALARMSRQLRADLPLVVPAPFIGLLWTYVDRGDLATWVGATALSAALGLWLGALRGSDPS